MANYLLIESRDPFSSNDVSFVYDLAGDLKRAGNTVTVFLVQNGVLPARQGPKSEKLTALVKSGVTVLADTFSLKERGIAQHRLVAGIQGADVDLVVDRLAEGWKAIWH